MGGDLLTIVALILGVVGALAFIRVTKLERYLKEKGMVDQGFDSMADLEQFNIFDRHRRRGR